MLTRKRAENLIDSEYYSDLSQEDLSLQDYRTLARYVLSSCYAILSTIQGTEGVEAIFSLLIPVLTEEYVLANKLELNQEAVLNEYVLACEVLIFAGKCILDQKELGEPDKYVIEIIKSILKLPRNVILTRSCLYFLKEAAPQTKFMPDYTNWLFEYCLGEIDNPVLVDAITEVQYIFYAHT